MRKLRLSCEFSIRIKRLPGVCGMTQEAERERTLQARLFKLLQSGRLAPLLYLALLVIWNVIVYCYLIKLEIDRWPLCWDFIHYYQCGAMALSPDRFQVYNAQVQLDWTNKLISPAHADELWFVHFLPFVFPLMIPVALLPLKLCYVLWCTVSTFAGVSTFVAILKQRKWPVAAISGFCLAAVACFPAWFNAWFGQFAWFYLCLLALYFFSLREKKDLRSGMLLALLSIKPQYMPYLLAPPLVSRRWKALVAMFVCELILVLLAVLTIGWDNVVHQPFIMLSTEQQTGIMQANAANMVSLRGLLSLFVPDRAVLWVSFILNVAAFPVMWLVWAKAFRKEAGSMLNWAMAVTLLAILVLSPHSHVYDCLFVMLAAALTLPSFRLSSVLALRRTGSIAETSGADSSDQLSAEIAEKGPLIKLAFRFWTICLYFYPIITWIFLFLTHDPYNRFYPKALAVLNLLFLCSGLAVFFFLAARKSDGQRHGSL